MVTGHFDGARRDLVCSLQAGHIGANHPLAGGLVTEPLVDIGIPTHGRPRYLREALDSVLARHSNRGGSRSRTTPSG